jgi:uncharacterized sulfatase
MHMAHNLRVPAHFGLRTARYKLIFFYGSDIHGGNRTPATWEFYDLKEDPHEMKNQYANPAYGETVSRLKAELKRVRADLHETDERYPGIQAIIDAHWNE